MDVRLVVADRKKRRQTLYLHKPESVIGRESGCDIRVPAADVSRRHCVLRLRDGYVTVEDLNSSNGTQLNGEPVSGRQVVRPGDRLSVGPTTFVVEYQLTSEAINRLLRGEESSGAYSDVDVVEQESAIPTAPAAEEEDLLPLEPAEEEELPTLEPVEEESVPVDELEVVDDMHLPESEEDLRDILTALEEDETPPPKKKKRK